MSGSANVKASTESFSQDVRIKNKVSRRILAFLAGEFPAKIGEALGRFWGEAIYKAGVKEALNWDSYDVVVSTYGPLWTHQIARQIKLKHPDITWIADFRDPFVISERTNTEKMRALAGEITHGADCVTAVSRGTIDNLFLPQDMNAYVLTNGYDVEESPIRTPCQSSLFRIVYTGTLVSEGGNKRDLSPLFIQLEELIASGEVDATKIRVEYAGSTAHLFAPFSRRFPSIPVLDHGLLSRKEALTLQESASLLVVASWNTSIQTGVLTGKIFEYMSKDIPIIGLCSGDVPSSDIRRLIEDSYLGVCYEEADEATYHILRDYLREKYHEWENMGRTTRDARSRQLVKKYSYPALADRFISIVNSLKSA